MPKFRFFEKFEEFFVEEFFGYPLTEEDYAKYQDFGDATPYKDYISNRNIQYANRKLYQIHPRWKHYFINNYDIVDNVKLIDSDLLTIIDNFAYPKYCDVIYKAEQYATECHKNTNHMYGNVPYKIHLIYTVEFAYKYKYLLSNEFIKTVIAACWLHDTIEDTRQNYNDIKENFGLDIAEIVYAVTTNKGRTRAERADSIYYHGIKNIHDNLAVFVKLCDRLANTKYSCMFNSRMHEVYKKEFDKFHKCLFTKELETMFQELKFWTFKEHI